MQRAEAIARAIQACGVPNYFGRQRFGRTGDNAQRGEELLTTSRLPGSSWKGRLLLSAYQAALFNAWLAERIRRGWFLSLLSGDIAKKWDTGGLFEVEDERREWPRFQRKEITYTGPIYGFRMR
ncbi:MAG: tRNA pseudouridine(13) synthase TruD, partial [Nitrospinota bacterium]